MKTLFALNPDADRAAATEAFAADGIAQVRDVLTPESAAELRMILREKTPWGLAWQAADDGPHALRAEELKNLAPEKQRELSQKIGVAGRAGKFAFVFSQYPLLKAYQEKWASDGPHDLLLEHINDTPMLDLVREVSGISQLQKADGQATLYAPNQFLGRHEDAGKAEEGWRVAYVLHLTDGEWHPDHGGQLQFLDEDGNVTRALRPEFNTLNLFAVPRRHLVSFVPGFAPLGRYAVTGWFRDR